MKNITILLFAILFSFLSTHSIFAQQKIKPELRAGAGWVVDKGYGVFAEVGVPIVKSIEIAPSFAYTSNLFFNYEPGTYAELAARDEFCDIAHCTAPDFPQFAIASININILFQPLDFLKKTSRHQISIGMGAGFKHYTEFQTDGYGTGSGIYINMLADYAYQVSKKSTIGLRYSLMGHGGDDGLSLVRFLAVHYGIKLYHDR